MDLSFYKKGKDVSLECEEHEDYDFFILKDENGEDVGDGDRGEDEKLNQFKKMLKEWEDRNA